MGDKGKFRNIEEIKDKMFVENLTCSGDNKQKALLLKGKSMKIFIDGGFTLCKWHSNYSSVAKRNTHENNDSLSTYSMEQVETINNAILIQKSMVLFGVSKITLLVHI